MSRYIVTELEGYMFGRSASTAGNARAGLSCMVVDTLWNRRVMATYRSEDREGGNRPRYVRHADARRRAAEHAAHLNEVAA